MKRVEELSKLHVRAGGRGGWADGAARARDSRPSRARSNCARGGAVGRRHCGTAPRAPLTFSAPVPPCPRRPAPPLQKTREEQHTAYLEERKALELKYEKVFAETYAKRAAVVAGTVDPAESSASKGVPNFWLQAMQNNRRCADFIEEADEEALASLVDVRAEHLPDMTGFKLTFAFGPNDYFTDKELTKTFYVPNLLEGSMFELDRAEGCEIHWKDGKDLTVKTVKKTVKKGKGRAKTVTKSEPVPSFFRFFETTEMNEELIQEMGEEAMAVRTRWGASGPWAVAHGAGDSCRLLPLVLMPLCLPAMIRLTPPVRPSDRPPHHHPSSPFPLPAALRADPGRGQRGLCSVQHGHPQRRQLVHGCVPPCGSEWYMSVRRASSPRSPPGVTHATSRGAHSALLPLTPPRRRGHGRRGR
jgi:hypothetical protein